MTSNQPKFPRPLCNGQSGGSMMLFNVWTDVLIFLGVLKRLLDFWA
jgi:hypothetical protein